MQTHQAPEHDDAASPVCAQAWDASGNPVAVSFAPDLHDTHHLRLKALLLTVWVVFSFGTSYFARDIQALMPGWPAAYWMAAQGAVLMFLFIIVIYCVAMDYFERKQVRKGSCQETADCANSSASASVTDFHA